jgi:hypothetical protein
VRTYTSDDGLEALRDDERQARQDAARLAETARHFADRRDAGRARWERARLALDVAENEAALVRRERVAP